jgi:hypothetical protein
LASNQRSASELLLDERIDALLLLAPFAQGWLSAPIEELVGWEDAEQVAAYEREWDHAYDPGGPASRCG